jgi:hypothetical protein
MMIENKTHVCPFVFQENKLEERKQIVDHRKIELEKLAKEMERQVRTRLVHR